MAPSRGKGKARATTASTPSRRTPRSTRNVQNGVPGVYREMLAEAAVDEPISETSDRPLKKRRVATGVSVPKMLDAASDEGSNRPSAGNALNVKPRLERRNLQTVEDSSASSENSDESDFGFEDVDLEQPSAPSLAAADRDVDDEGIADISISVDPTTTPKRSTPTRRKPGSVAEKAFRLVVHKAHILCLLGHCMYVNSWCNNEVVHRYLRSLLSKRMLSYLNPKVDDSQFQRNRSFMDGLAQASEAWRGVFRVTATGMRRARWATSGHGEESALKDETDPMDRADFITAAKNLEGSQDCGNQLFCALLRSAGVEARLVCSLQPLPFADVSTKPSTPQKLSKPTVYAMASGTDTAASDSNAEDSSVRSSSTIGKVPSARRRLGQPTFAPEPAATSTPAAKRKTVRKLAYPVFWVEAFNTAHQKWIPVDPLVTQTVNKPSKLEPPSSYEWNQLNYAIAFEPSGVARDVTRRYAKAYNAKTRRHRVEGTTNGATWLRKALRLFRRPKGEELDRDSIEDAELAQKEAREGLPGNVQDFKEHPYYSLERHLRRHEVLHQRREVGKVNAGTAAKPRMEAVFRRQDVVECKSADRWLRVGREVVEGEQPLKRVPARRVKGREVDEDDEEEKTMTALYAPFQTLLYVPPPVVKGKVPRNAYGNLDIYVPSMVPAGGVHVRHPLAKEAAKTLKIDAVDAVTGFQFKGRQGSAVVEGVVICEDYADAVQATIAALQEEQTEDQSAARSGVALRMWKRFLTGLRIAERVRAYGNKDVEEDVEMEEDGDGDGDEAAGGGFLPTDGVDGEEALPTAGRFSLAQLSTSAKVAKRSRKKDVADDSEDEEEEEFEDRGSGEDDEESVTAGIATRRGRRVVDEEESEDEALPDHAAPLPDGMDHDEGGGFLPEDDFDNDGGGGGFMHEDDNMVGDRDENNSDGFLVGRNGDPSAPYPDSLEEHMNDEAGGGLLTDDDQPSLVQDRTAVSPAPTYNNIDATVLGTREVEGTDTTIVAANGERESLEISRDTENHSQTFYAGLEDTPRPIRNFDLSPTNAALAVALSTPAEAQGEEEESDRGSMFSHDPSDEDAEPDWLGSD